MTVILSAKRDAKEIKADLAAMTQAGKRINASPASARAFLVKHGFITKRNKLTKRYR